MQAKSDYSYSARDIYYSYRKITKYSKAERLTDKQFIALLTTFINRYIWQQLDKGLAAVFPYKLFKIYIIKCPYPKSRVYIPTYLDKTDGQYYRIIVRLDRKEYPLLYLRTISFTRYKAILHSKILEWFGKNKYYPAKIVK